MLRLGNLNEMGLLFCSALPESKAQTLLPHDCQACSLRDASQEFSLLRRCCSFNLLRYDGPPIAAVPGKARFLRAQTSSALYGTGRTIDRQWIYQAKKDQASRNNRAQRQDVLPRLLSPVQFALLYEEVFVVVPTIDLSVARRFLHSYSLPPESACRWNTRDCRATKQGVPSVPS